MAATLRSAGTVSKLVSCGSIPSRLVEPLAISPKKLRPVSYEGYRVTGLSSSSSKRFLLNSLATKDVTVIARRYTHTDVQFPSFDDDRRKDTLNSSSPARESEDWRRSIFPAVYYGIGGLFSVFTGKEAIQTLVNYKWMPDDQKALASIEVKMDEIPEGEHKTYEWRGKPVFVHHRTSEDIARERAVPMNELRDPQRDEDRVQKDEWLVLIGVCTHLGCVPVADAGEFNGYFCPCHGSQYDGSGRIRRGPAPTNLEVPDYKFTDENTIIVGAK